MFHVWSGGSQVQELSGYNYFGLSIPSDLNSGYRLTSTSGLTAREAYEIDSKIDDGAPQTGIVIAMYITGGGFRWSNWWNNVGAFTTATPNQANYCFNNNNTAGLPQKYAITQTNGALNCGISFRFQ